VRDIDKVIGALRSPMRREILRLIWNEERAAGEIAAALPVTKPTVSQHLAVLREAGLVTRTATGTSRRYRARQEALSGLHGALEGALKWVPANPMRERSLSNASIKPVVVVTVEVETDQATTFDAFTDDEVYSEWLGVPVRIEDGRFAATMKWGTEVRGSYDVVSPPELIAMRWDFDDDNVPVPGRELVGYLRVEPTPSSGSVVEVHQLVETPEQAVFMQAAWSSVLGRFRARGVAATSSPSAIRRRRKRDNDRNSA
jgi:DNA-binding transcriptional ArsR family regulator